MASSVKNEFKRIRLKNRNVKYKITSKSCSYSSNLDGTTKTSYSYSKTISTKSNLNYKEL